MNEITGDASDGKTHDGSDATPGTKPPRLPYVKPTIAKKTIHDVTLLSGGTTSSAMGGFIAAAQ